VELTLLKPHITVVKATKKGVTMKHYVGVDFSMKEASIYIIDQEGK